MTAVDETLHVVNPAKPTRTLCGLRCERGVHRCATQFLRAHIDGRGAIACKECAGLTGAGS